MGNEATLGIFDGGGISQQKNVGAEAFNEKVIEDLTHQPFAAKAIGDKQLVLDNLKVLSVTAKAEIDLERNFLRPNIGEERKVLLNNVSAMPRELKEQVLQDMKLLESPLRHPPLTDQQLQSIYKSSTDILTDPKGKSPLNLASRQLIAAGVIDNATNPSGIDQGMHSTCAVATLEERLYTLQPEKAAEHVAQVTLTGAIGLSSGKPVKIQLNPDLEGRIPPGSTEADGIRNYASQVFQLAVLNEYLAETFFDDFEKQPFRQFRSFAGDDTGERIFDKDGKEYYFSGVPVESIGYLGHQLGMKDEFFLVSDYFELQPDTPGASTVRDVDDLKNRLVTAKQNLRLPLIVGVSADHPLIGNSPGGHVVSITDVHTDKNPPTVDISNQWGSWSDLKNVPLAKLYEAMISPEYWKKQLIEPEKP